MQVKQYTREEITDLVDSHLASSVNEGDIRMHMTSAFVDSLFKKRAAFPILLTNRPDCTLLSDMYGRGNYDALVTWGDSIMILCGWFPEWISKERHASLGMGYYAGLAVDCYNTAVNLSNEKRAHMTRADPSVVNYLSDHFLENTAAYFRLKEEIATQEVLSKQVRYELNQVFGIKPKSEPKIVFVPGPTRGSKRGFSDVSGGGIIGKEDMPYIRLDELLERQYPEETSSFSAIEGKNMKSPGKDYDRPHLTLVKG